MSDVVMPAGGDDPAAEYRRRLAAHESRLADIERRHERLGLLRLILAASFLVLAGSSWALHRPGAAWTLVPALAFLAALLVHAGVRRRRLQARAAVGCYRSGLERLEGRWRGRGRDGRRFEDPHHRYAADLDLFGPGNLFELLCMARTQIGEEFLASWLLRPCEPEALRARHAAIDDLRRRIELREDWATLGGGEPVELHPARLAGWAQADNRLARSWIAAAAWALTLLAIGAACFWAAGGSKLPFAAAAAAEGALLCALRKPIREALFAIETAYEDLKRLRTLIERIERERFTSARLRELLEALGAPGGATDRTSAEPAGAAGDPAAAAGSRGGGGTSGGREKLAATAPGRSASAALSRLATIVNWVESRRNPLLVPLMLLLLYPLHTALAAERWRRAHGARVAPWLAALGEFEALLSLSRHAYEQPGHPFPVILDAAQAGGAAFAACGLGHPLLPAATRICNDVDLRPPARLLLVSGSNMSGKSTLLRAVGINAVLAMAGAPVCARTLALTPLAVGASIRINDSLHEGSSRFYAEITRIKQMLEPTALPLLFLLDELLQGTNSADRSVGARGIALGLMRRGAIGLISTHDLALVDIPGLPEGALRNVHFQDELADGRLSFDYRLRPGVVTKSNGVELMRSIGLEV